jgi:hypothetical protein
LNGVQTINGTMMQGQIPYLFKFIDIYFLPRPGVKTFTGLRIYDKENNEQFFLGSALIVNLSSN